jgi:epoxyqueuosine reductase
VDTASSLRDRVVERAHALGFDAVGIARADVPLGLEHDRYAAFVAGGMHGDMGYLAEDVDARRRLDGDAILPGAKSVIVAARSYARSPSAEAEDPPVARLIARYARGRDYHNHLRKKLRLLAKFVRTLGPEVRARPLSDVEPVLERAWAARAGLGFVGKNGLIIVPGGGSFVLLGEVVTTLDLPADTPLAERCGSCTRCLDACPTAAFQAPFVLDPRKCVAYLTIEARSPPPRELDPLMGDHLFGCDDCQTVCPFNKTQAPSAERTRAYAPHARWGEVDVGTVAALDDRAFEELTAASPVRRATRAVLTRNALRIATRWAKSDDGEARERGVQALRKARGSPDPGIRASAEAVLAEVDASTSPPPK